MINMDLKIIEKDPTTYLFRRNVATRLYHLGFAWTKIQYWIAHEIEDTLIMRNFFADEDTLYQLGQQYEMHPIFHIMFGPHTYKHPEQHSIAQNQSLYIIATANEPEATINLSIRSSTPVQIFRTELPSTDRCNETVDILNYLYQAYWHAYSNHIR